MYCGMVRPLDPRVNALVQTVELPVTSLSDLGMSVEDYRGARGVEETIARKAGNCIDIANLLCSMYRSRGYSDSDVYVVLCLSTYMHEGTHALCIDRLEGAWSVIDTKTPVRRPLKQDVMENSGGQVVVMYNDVRTVFGPSVAEVLL